MAGAENQLESVKIHSLARGTGTRLSEMAGFDLGDVHIDDRPLFGFRSWRGKAGRRGTGRLAVRAPAAAASTPSRSAETTHSSRPGECSTGRRQGAWSPEGWWGTTAHRRCLEMRQPREGRRSVRHSHVAGERSRCGV